MGKKLLGLVILVVLISSTSLYLYSTGKPKVNLVGQGSTFVYPLMSAWICLYGKVRKNISVNYQSTGSGAGIRAILDGTVDFAASDAPMNHDEWSRARERGTILQFPITIGAVVVAYNLPDLNGRLRLNGTIIADIYLGKISKWNDPAIRALNPNLDLPDREIYVVKRSDGSGTTYVFTDYLSSVSDEWREKIGKTKIFAFDERVGDRGISSKGNEGVGQSILQTPYSIGYIELAYAIETHMTFALLQNRDGYFVDANTTTIAEAAANAYAGLPKPEDSWENVTMVNQPGKLSYPISSFVYMMVYREQTDEVKALALKDWISWILTSGQDISDDLLYVPLPENVRNIGLSAANEIIAESPTAADDIFSLNTLPFPILSTIYIVVSYLKLVV